MADFSSTHTKLGRTKKIKARGVKATRNRILFNLGALDTRLASDIEGQNLLFSSQDNQTSYGTEGSGFKRWEIGELAPLNESTVKFLATQSGGKLHFLEHYAKVLVLSLKGEALSANDFAFVRERQMDQCYSMLGADAQTLIVDLIQAIVGGSPRDLGSFAGRHNKADQGLLAAITPSLCGQFKN